MLILAANPLTAQVTFMQPDPATNLGITATPGLMGFAWGDYDGDGDLDLYQLNVRQTNGGQANNFEETKKLILLK